MPVKMLRMVNKLYVLISSCAGLSYLVTANSLLGETALQINTFGVMKTSIERLGVRTEF